MLKRIKELRKQKGVSQQQLAEQIGVSQQSVNKYENHDIEPDVAVLTAIADYFETSVDYVVGRTDVAHKIEPVRPFDLNAEETALLTAFRRLNKENRALVCKLAAALGQ